MTSGLTILPGEDRGPLAGRLTSVVNGGHLELILSEWLEASEGVGCHTHWILKHTARGGGKKEQTMQEWMQIITQTSSFLPNSIL